MSYKFTISTDSYSGYSGNITYYPSTGGTIDLGSVMLPYIYYTEYYYGQYIIDMDEFDKTCVLNYLPPPEVTPTVTSTTTPTPTPTPTLTPTNTQTPTVTSTTTPTPTLTPTNTQTPTVTPTTTPIPRVQTSLWYSVGNDATMVYYSITNSPTDFDAKCLWENYWVNGPLGCRDSNGHNLRSFVNLDVGVQLYTYDYNIYSSSGRLILDTVSSGPTPGYVPPNRYVVSFTVGLINSITNFTDLPACVPIISDCIGTPTPTPTPTITPTITPTPTPTVTPTTTPIPNIQTLLYSSVGNTATTVNYSIRNASTEFDAKCLWENYWVNGPISCRDSQGQILRSFVNLGVGVQLYTYNTAQIFGESGRFILDTVITQITPGYVPPNRYVVSFTVGLINSITNFTDLPACVPIISNCYVNKGASCGLYIQGIQPNCQLASLSVGALSSRSGCTIGAYVIDWYLNDINGSPSFTSGSDVNASSDVTVVQPFSDEPAEGGTWFPVIRFAYLNGIQYTSDINLVNGSVKYSPDFSTIIDSICVEAFTCSSGIQGNTYPVTVSYLNTTQNSTRAERSISWDLSPITKNFAWAFKGFSVYDTISIRYISPTNNINSQIENWKVGFDAGTNSLTSNPKVYSYGSNSGLFPDSLKLVTSLTGFTYTNGDYLLINVMPNPTNTNTNWGFSGKCLTDTASLDCGSLFNGNFNKDGYNFSNITSTFDSSSCNLTISGITRNSPIYTATTSNNNFFKYHGITSYFLDAPIFRTQLIPNLNINLNKIMLSSVSAGYTDRGCLNQISGTTINKSGSTLTLTFDDITDYNVYKTQYNNVINNSTFTNYVNDPSNINYYKYFTLGVLSGTTCGDTLGVSYFYETHVSSPFIFDDLNKKITVILLPPINGYTSGEACNTSYSTVNDKINRINNFISAPNYTFKTYVRRGESPGTTYNAVGGTSAYIQQFNATQIYGDQKIVPKPNVCYSSTYEWCLTDNFYLLSYLFRFYLIVTDITDPTNNFKIQNMLDSNGCSTSPYLLLYEISNGIVIFPI